MAGYSGTPLVAKLGIKPGQRVLLDRPPAGFELSGLPAGVRVHRRAGREPYDLLLSFTTASAELERRFDALTALLPPDGVLWVAWPKRTVPPGTVRPDSDMTEDLVRDVCLPRGWVDVKVCAVDAVWSGLKLVLRRENRP